MVKVYKNMDLSQSVAFRKIEDLKKWMLKNEILCDGLAWGHIEEYNEFQMDMVFIDGEWEVEYFPQFDTNVLSFEEAVEEFVDFVKEHNNE